MVSIQACLQAADSLESESARLDVELLLADVLGKSRTYLITWPEKILTDKELNQFEQLLIRRQKGEPIAHILGEREFWSLPFYTNASTLIPRPDTECLVEFAEDYLRSLNAPTPVLDLGTGTGAIAMALASMFAEHRFLAVDYSCDAVALAEKNRARLGLTNVELRQSDWFSAVDGLFGLIVSNPPYIDGGDPHLAQGDVRFEPTSALIAEDNGLADIKIIIDQSRAYLKRDGLLMIEHGFNQAGEVAQLFVQAGYTKITSHKDYGGNLRFTLGYHDSSSM